MHDYTQTFRLCDWSGAKRFPTVIQRDTTDIICASTQSIPLGRMARSTMKNNSENGWVVQKFGGTSVGKFPDKIAEDIVQPYLRNNKIVVVCSARSSGKKVTGTTSRCVVLVTCQLRPCQWPITS